MRWALAGQQNGGITMLQFVSALAIVAVAIIGGVFKLVELRMTQNKNEILKRNTEEHQVTAETAQVTQELVMRTLNTLDSGQRRIEARLDAQDARSEGRHALWVADRQEIFRRLPPETTGEVPITITKETES
jgi:uncharacterized metal-binding protein